MLNIPYDFKTDFNQEGTYQDYATLRKRCEQFSTFTTFGKDESGQYDMFYIGLGDKTKPCILICGNIHPPEWRSTQAMLEKMERFNNGTYPDKSLQSRLDDFYIAFCPVVNPWGVDRVEDIQYGIYASANPARYNVNGVDLNRDFYEFTQKESQNIRELGNKLQPFAVIDLHEYQPDYNVSYERNSILASGQMKTPGYQEQTLPYVIEWQESMENYIGEPITRWTNLLDETSGLLRGHFAKQTNPWTPYTLSYIIEVVRPAYRDRNGTMTYIEKLSESEMYRYSMAHLYFFLSTSIRYFDTYGNEKNDFLGNGDYVTSIRTEEKDVTFTRNSDMVLIKMIEKFRTPNITIETTFIRNHEGKVTQIERKEVGSDDKCEI